MLSKVKIQTLVRANVKFQNFDSLMVSCVSKVIKLYMLIFNYSLNASCLPDSVYLETPGAESGGCS